MSEEIRTEYKGYPIDYNEDTGNFRAFVDGTVAFENPSLRALKELIDHFEKQQGRKDFMRFKVLVLREYPKYDFSVGEVTSITEGGEYWVSVGGKRSKTGQIIPFTDANNEIALKMVALKNEENRLYKERFELDKTLVRLSGGVRP